VSGRLPTSQRGLELSRQGVALTAFGPNPDGNGTLLRLWELAGQSGNATVTLPPELKAVTAQPVDLRGRPSGAAVPIRSDTLVVPLRGFAPASFELQGGTK